MACMVSLVTRLPVLSISTVLNAPYRIQAARADRGAINITLNSFGGPLNEPHMRTGDRRRLYPAIGMLYPEATNAFQVHFETRCPTAFTFVILTAVNIVCLYATCFISDCLID